MRVEHVVLLGALLALIPIIGTAEWITLQRVQRRILRNTEMILSVLRSVHGFYDEAGYCKDVTEINVAAMRAQDALEGQRSLVDEEVVD